MQLYSFREFFSDEKHRDRHIFRDIFAVSPVVATVVSGDHDGVSVMDSFVDLLDVILCQEKVQIKNDFFPSCQHT